MRPAVLSRRFDYARTIIVFAISLALTFPASASVAECDRLAASNLDTTLPREVQGVPFDEIDAPRAISACQQAKHEAPDNPRVLYQLGRALDKADRDAEAASEYKIAAAKGHVLALHNLGVVLNNGGQGVPANKTVAFALIKTAAERGLSLSMVGVGVMYRDGDGVAVDAEQALGWFERAANAGNKTGRRQAIDLLLSDKFPGGPSYVRATPFLLALARDGDADSQYQLAVAISEGKITASAGGDSARWFRAAADQGKVEAQFKLGEMFRFGDGVAKDEGQAVVWYKKAAEQGYAAAQNGLGYMYQKGYGVSQNAALAIAWYRKAADQNYALSQNDLGIMLFAGEGVPQDRAAAVELWRKAANQGLSKAQLNLGMSLAEGTGIKQDQVAAVSWYRKAADQGMAEAQLALGDCYFKAVGLAKNDAAAFSWYLKAAEQGLAPAQNKVGVMLDQGVGVAVDQAAALNWYRKAADQGFAFAQFNLAVSYYTGQGVPQNKAQALALFRDAANQGHAVAQQKLGAMYSDGDGVAQDKVQAAAWYSKAAEQGEAEAQNNLGFMYESGEGVIQDTTAAVKWYHKAAEQGLAEAQNNLGTHYYHGKYVPRNKTAALEWFQKAANQGHAIAQFHLGVLYEHGDGVAQNNAEALVWHQKAALQGHKDAAQAVSQLTARVYEDARRLERGEGVPENKAEAVRLYRSAAGAGHIESMYRLADMTEDGVGVSKNDAEAAVWFRKAAENGHVESMVGLARLLNQGTGARKYPAEAAVWLEKASNAGHPMAMYSFAIHLDEGKGIGIDRELAARWLLAALRKGNQFSRDQLRAQASAWHIDTRRALQRRLIALAAFAGPTDGEFGAPTQAAIDRVFGTFKESGVPQDVIGSPRAGKTGVAQSGPVADADAALSVVNGEPPRRTTQVFEPTVETTPLMAICNGNTRSFTLRVSPNVNVDLNSIARHLPAGCSLTDDTKRYTENLLATASASKIPLNPLLAVMRIVQGRADDAVVPALWRGACSEKLSSVASLRPRVKTLLDLMADLDATTAKQWARLPIALKASINEHRSALNMIMLQCGSTVPGDSSALTHHFVRALALGEELAEMARRELQTTGAKGYDERSDSSMRRKYDLVVDQLAGSGTHLMSVSSLKQCTAGWYNEIIHRELLKQVMSKLLERFLHLEGKLDMRVLAGNYVRFVGLRGLKEVEASNGLCQQMRSQASGPTSDRNANLRRAELVRHHFWLLAEQWEADIKAENPALKK